MGKYKLTPNTVVKYGMTLYQLQALRDFADVKVGDYGGFVSGYHNLSQDGDCWIYDSAVVAQNAKINNNVQVRNDAFIGGNAQLYDNSRVEDRAQVVGDAEMHNNAWVSGNGIVAGKTSLYQSSRVRGNSRVDGNAMLAGNSKVCGYAHITDSTTLAGEVEVSGYASIGGNVCIFNDMFIGEDAVINSKYDYLFMDCVDNHIDCVLLYKTVNGYNIYTDLFSTRDVDSFLCYAIATDESHQAEYTLIAELLKLRIQKWEKANEI